MKRYLGIIFVALILGAVLWGIKSWLLKPDTLPFEKIVLLNQLQAQDAEQLQLVASKAIDGGFFSQDIAQLREAIEKLPWVESVSIRKKWPQTLQLAINERQPIARWLSMDEKAIKPQHWQKKWHSQRMLSLKADIFDAPMNKKQSAKFSNYRLLVGPESLAAKVLSECEQIAKKLSETQLEVKVCGLDLRRSWWVLLDQGFELRLGRNLQKGKYKSRLDDFVLAYEANLKPFTERIAYIDLRYTNGFSMAWKKAPIALDDKALKQ